jgi:hypothetical protein
MPDQLEVMPNPSQIPEVATLGHELDNATRVGSVISFFNSEFGLDMNESGTLEADPTEQQLDDLKAWHEKTSDDGIIMPDIDTFAAKVVLAQSLMPQVDQQGNIQYLFGKGVATELAIQGAVSGRQKSEQDTPSRSHSDFEIYGVEGASYSNIEHSDRFRAVFGGQEIYPLDSTKVLRGLAPDFLHDTANTVDYGGVRFLVPKLELQFVEKLISDHQDTEMKLRGHTDAALLATTYPLDVGYVHQVIDEHIIKPELAQMQDVGEESALISAALIRKVAQARNGLMAENPEANDEQIGLQLGSDQFINSYLNKKGVTIPIQELVDLVTTQLRPEASMAISHSLELKRAQRESALRSRHDAADRLLRDVA